jgi:serine/threonine protein kinase
MYYEDSTKPSLSLSRGDTIREYEILETIGTGGMASVYKARHTLLKQKVAIKIMKPSLTSDSQFCERFIREAQTQAQLTGHQNIVTIHNFIEEEGMYIIVMEYMSGIDVMGRRIRTLAEYIKQFGALAFDEFYPVFRDVISGLCFAHEQGVVHRDIKPSNIMFSKKGITKIVDFGIARIISDPKLTRTGVAVGTPKYMSPEQVRGKDLDERSDLYSLGISMYEALTAQVPFDGETDYEIMKKQEEDTPVAPRTLNPEIPEHWEQLILGCMEKSPENRPGSCREIEATMNSVKRAPGEPVDRRVFTPAPVAPLSDAPSSQKPPTTRKTPVTGQRTGQRIRYRWLYRILGGVFVVLVLAAVYYFLFHLPHQRTSGPEHVRVVPNVSEGELFSASPARRFTDIGNLVAHSDYVKEAYIMCAEANLNEVIQQLRGDEPEITYIHFADDKNVVIASSDTSVMGAVFNSDLPKSGPSTVRGRERFYEGAFEIKADETRLGALYFGALLAEDPAQMNEKQLFTQRFSSVGTVIAHSTFVKDAYVMDAESQLRRHVSQFCSDIPEMQFIHFVDDSNRIIASNKPDMLGNECRADTCAFLDRSIAEHNDQYEGYFGIFIGDKKVGALYFGIAADTEEKAGG